MNTVILNGVEINRKQFELFCVELMNDPTVEIVKLSEGVYKTRYVG